MRRTEVPLSPPHTERSRRKTLFLSFSLFSSPSTRRRERAYPSHTPSKAKRSKVNWDCFFFLYLLSSSERVQESGKNGLSSTSQKKISPGDGGKEIKSLQRPACFNLLVALFSVFSESLRFVCKMEACGREIKEKTTTTTPLFLFSLTTYLTT